MQSKDEPIRPNEAGAYGDLIDRPNPGGFLIQPVPPFEETLRFFIKMSGHEPTEEEIERKRRLCPAIVLTQEAAARLAARKAKRKRIRRPIF